MSPSTPEPLATAYDLAVLDLDGVVYVGRAAVPGAAAALVEARALGMHLAFVTNNAARTPQVVGEHLRELGIPAGDNDVVTSAQAAARVVADLVPAGSSVYVIGGEGLEVALRDERLRPVAAPEGPDGVPAAVVQGYGPTMPWRQVVDGAILVAQGLPWVASNLDLTIPTARGRGPGNGALVGLVARFAEREPVVAGKPEPALFEETLRRVGGSHPLVVGDRLDTDIQGAVNVGWDSLLVMTGVTDLQALVGVEPRLRPTHVGADLSCLLEPVKAAEALPDGARCGGWSAVTSKGRLEVTGEGSLHEWWRAVALAGWQHLDATGAPVKVDGVMAPSTVTP